MMEDLQIWMQGSTALKKVITGVVSDHETRVKRLEVKATL